MKQNITVKQLDELSPLQFEKLVRWVTGLSVISNWTSFEGIMISNPSLKEKSLLSIGQMIEFLAEHVERYREGIFIDQGSSVWYTGVISLEPSRMRERISAPELCDVLWKACKEILEEKEVK